MRITLGSSDAVESESEATTAKHGSAAEAVGGELLSVNVEIPWDSYLGAGATERISDGSLRLVRHAYPATAAADLLVGTTPTGHLYGDAAFHERVASVALGIASLRHSPARMPHRPTDEPHAWWIAEERTLVWLPWADIDEPPYGLDLIDRGEADAVTVIAPDASWTIYPSGIPARGSNGDWEALPQRLRVAMEGRVAASDRSTLTWERKKTSDQVEISWQKAGSPMRAVIEVNRR